MLEPISHNFPHWTVALGSRKGATSGRDRHETLEPQREMRDPTLPSPFSNVQDKTV